MNSVKTKDSTKVKPGQGQTYRYSTFILSDKIFGFEILSVKEVLPLPKLTRIPNVSAYIHGVFNLRGNIMSLMDLRYFLGLEPKPFDPADMVLVLENKNIRIAVAVERVLDIVTVAEDDIQATTREIPVQIAQFTAGLFEKEGLGTIHLLDSEVLLNTPELQKYR